MLLLFYSLKIKLIFYFYFKIHYNNTKVKCFKLKNINKVVPMRKIFIILILMLSIFSIANAHPFKTEKELYDYYAEIDKKINEELKNNPEKILKDRKNSLKPLYLDVFGADKVLGDNSYLFGFDKNGKIMSVMKRAVLDGPSMIARIYYPNGNLKEVYLDDDDFVTGIVRTYYESEKKHEEIPYYKGKKEGLRKIYFENGNLSNEVYYVDDLREGKTIDYYNDGKVFRLKNYKDNIGNGEFTEYYRNGQIKVKGNYKGGLREGEFKFYSESNKYLGSVFYKNKEIIKNTLSKEDMKDLSASFEFTDMALFLRSTTRDIVGATTDVYPSGKPRIYMPYSVNGELHGDYIEFYEDGKISYKITYENGIRHGKSISYLENGKIIGETNYIDGKKEGKSF
ncbi:phosphatidylinositol-4-phosphate 5-kinase [Fusobacterium nucleatum subsp. nucleatum]|nr:phosphatidylinositol-4-phosphate 5-kinase [Fusobacterium nucleatum subsp. nucleatum]